MNIRELTNFLNQDTDILLSTGLFQESAHMGLCRNSVDDSEGSGLVEGLLIAKMNLHNELCSILLAMQKENKLQVDAFKLGKAKKIKNVRK